ncbi:MAG: hypothetical protein J1D77_08655 [Muribaculaceae bacterium]|nr:hypothetical protein [Muribaculaceae bacterium]
MKTLSNLIREIFAARRSDRERPPVVENPRPKVKPIQKPQTNETKDHQDPGNPQLDNSLDREADGDAQEQQSTNSNPQSGTQLESQQEREQQEREQREQFEQELRNAFQQGVIAGRNTKIEETFFPTTDDEIPRLNGRSPRQGSLDDIFSLAREA